jgi:hypothetical protein
MKNVRAVEKAHTPYQMTDTITVLKRVLQDQPVKSDKMNKFWPIILNIAPLILLPIDLWNRLIVAFPIFM